MCNNAILFKTKDVEMMAKTVEDISGRVTRREICGFNKFGDVRYCRNWDTGENRTDMKNSKGVWIKVDDE